MEVRDRLVVVTGASSGIGAAVAKKLGAEGAHVVLVARRAEKLEEVAAQIEDAGAQASIVVADLSTQTGAKATAEATLAIGAPDIVINNAGAGAWKYVDETDPDDVVSMMALPYFASFWVTRALIEPMIERRSGVVLMVNSPAWIMGWPGATGYASARAAQHGFAEGLREDVRSRGVRVIEVTLGEVSSEYFHTHADSHERLPTIAKTLIGVIAPERAASVIVRAIRRGRERVLAPRMLWLIYHLYRYFPPIVRWLVRRTGHRR